jgi:hypothetical protein
VVKAETAEVAEVAVQMMVVAAVTGAQAPQAVTVKNTKSHFMCRILLLRN